MIRGIPIYPIKGTLWHVKYALDGNIYIMEFDKIHGWIEYLDCSKLSFNLG